jgi:cobalamin biosynthesis protein CobT
MSEEIRYRALVNSVGVFYGAEIKHGLLEVLKLQTGWAVIRDDTRRFLAIWAEYAGFNNTVLEKQLLGMLDEFAQAPSLVVAEKITHVISMDMDVEETVKVVKEPEPESESEEEVESEEEEEEEEEEEPEPEVKVEKVEAEAEAEDEAEAEEDEEEGMEVEQITLRGRKYFKDVKTNKLYVDDNDEPGEEVGSLVNGKPVFLAKK